MNSQPFQHLSSRIMPCIKHRSLNYQNPYNMDQTVALFLMVGNGLPSTKDPIYYLEGDCHTVHQSTGDADIMIVHCALQLGYSGN